MEQGEQQGGTGHVSIGIESNSRGLNWSVKTVVPIGASQSDVDAARDLAQRACEAAVQWVQAKYGTPSASVTVKP